MNCPKCGAEIKSGNFCEFCGAQITGEMKKEQEQLNKQGCPRCGSTNIEFKRENHGEVRGKNSKQIVHRTVGFCKDCGTTWYPDGEEVKKRKTWLWVLGWIFIFPVPLTILMLRKKEMNPIAKYAIIAIAWIFYLIVGFSGNSSDTSSKPSSTSQVVDEAEKTEVDDTAKVEEIKIEETEKTSEPEIEEIVEEKIEEVEDNATLGEKNALAKAHSYLSFSAFSYKGLIEQLEYEGFSTEEATYAVDNCGADWNEQAAKKAESYLDFSSFSRSGLIEQLEFEGFTKEQAEYGVTAIGY